MIERRISAVLGLWLACAGLACTVNTTSSVGPSTGPQPDATATAGDGGGPIEPEVDDGKAPVPTSTPSDDAPPSDGAKHCTTNADCGDGVCEGKGCGDGEGVCAPKQRMCTRDARLYCGCDGTEFRASGTCPGKRFANEGPCASGTP